MMLSNKLLRLTAILLSISVLLFNSALADSLDKASLEKRASLALEGYDVTTYFHLNGVKLGKDDFQAVYQGKRYLFANEENQQKFAKNPAPYLPQYDGLCAHSLSMQKDIVANPGIYTLQEGKLYMFSSEDARAQWSKDSNKSLLAANKNWTFEAEKRQEQITAKKRWKHDNSVTLFSF